MPRTAETASFKFNHTMLRVKDPKVSLDFYTRILGMDLISNAVGSVSVQLGWIEKDNSDFTLYFLAFNHSGRDLSDEEKQNSRLLTSLCSWILYGQIKRELEGVLELTHNHGTETDPTFQGYASGNTEPGRGFGHIAITVDDVEKACERFEQLGVQFKKKPSEGKMRHIAFILDPDGYWIEIVPGILDL